MKAWNDRVPLARRVLVVDDEESIRSFAERALRIDGYDVVVAASGPEALRIADRQHHFDLCVLDVVMPDMSGDELARQLRLTDPDVKVLYLTGYADRLFAAKPKLWEHEAFVDKPVTIDGLLEAAALLLYGHTRRSR